MTRRIRRLLMLVALVAMMTLGGASAALAGHPGDHPGNSAAAKCAQQQTGWPDLTERWPETAQGDPGAPHADAASVAWAAATNASWQRCTSPAQD